MTVSERAVLVSAPGKVILFGEHAVVYGKPAVAASLNLRTYLLAEVSPRESAFDGVELWLPELDLKCSWSAANLKRLVALASKEKPCYLKPPEVVGDELSREVAVLSAHLEPKVNKKSAVEAFLVLYAYITACGYPPKRLKVAAKSALPIGSGLGSSASYCVCLAAGLLSAVSRQAATKPSPDIVNSWAFLAETAIHGTPSGIDNAVATFGGAMFFVKGYLAPLKGFKSCRFLLTDTMVPRSTREQVDLVRRKKQQFPKIFNPILDAIEAISEECQRLSNTSDVPRDEVEDTLETLIDINHHLIATAGVSHPYLERVRLLTATYGLHSKLTGAGGGGCMLTLIREDTPPTSIDHTKKLLAAEGFVCFETSIGGPGFRLVEVADMKQDPALLFGPSKPSECGGLTWMDGFAGCDFTNLEAAFSLFADPQCT